MSGSYSSAAASLDFFAERVYLRGSDMTSAVAFCAQQTVLKLPCSKVGGLGAHARRTHSFSACAWSTVPSLIWYSLHSKRGPLSCGGAVCPLPLVRLQPGHGCFGMPEAQTQALSHLQLDRLHACRLLVGVMPE